MMDAAPTLFRSLEKPQPAGQLDTVVLAAVSAYASLSRPTGQQSAELSRLLASGWHSIADDTRRNVAQELSSHASLPADIAALIEPERASPPPSGPTAPMLGLVRKTLLRLAADGTSAGARPVATVQAVAEAALRRDTDKAVALLAEAFTLPMARRDEMAREASGNLLAMALKALKAGPGDALGILMILRPALATDLPAFDRMAAFYRALDADTCRSALMVTDSQASGFGRLRQPSADEPSRSHFGKRLRKPELRLKSPG